MAFVAPGRNEFLKARTNFRTVGQTTTAETLYTFIGKYGRVQLAGAADHVELHNVGSAANAHGRSGDDADDIALPDQPLFQQTFFCEAGQRIDFLDVHDAARRDAPEERHAPASFHFG